MTSIILYQMPPKLFLTLILPLLWSIIQPKLSCLLDPKDYLQTLATAHNLSSCWLCTSGTSLQTILPLPIETTQCLSFPRAQLHHKTTSFRSDHIESIFLQVLREWLNLILINLSTPQPRRVLTNLTEPLIYPICFQGGHPQGYPIDNISTQYNHNFTLTLPLTSEQHWNTTNQTIQAEVKWYKKTTSPAKHHNILVFKIQVPKSPSLP